MAATEVISAPATPNGEEIADEELDALEEMLDMEVEGLPVTWSSTAVKTLVVTKKQP